MEKLKHKSSLRFPQGHDCLMEYFKAPKNYGGTNLINTGAAGSRRGYEGYRCTICNNILDIGFNDYGDTTIFFPFSGENISWENIKEEYSSYTYRGR